MADSEQQVVFIKGKDENGNDGILYFSVYDSRDRLLRAAKALVGFWILAILSLPIIVAHWFLVPGFFIAGIVVAWGRYQASTVPEKVGGQCPDCGNDLLLPLEAKEKLPLYKYCPSCGDSLLIQDK